jgi:PleD family two-component response regulator
MEKVGETLREKILIVQDAPSYHTATPDLLYLSGYATALVQQRSRALDKVGEESPDLVILDFGTASLEDLQLLAQLKSDRFTQHIPIFVVGTHGPISNRTHWLTSGADDCLDYPYHPEVLNARIRALLRRTVTYDPVSHLPAGTYVQRQVDVWLARDIKTVVLYVDIDHFASYNSAYGREAGKLVLQYLASLIVDVLPNGNLSVGHLSEDDFMMAFPPLGIETFAQTLVDRFRAAQREFYDESDFARGYIPEMDSSLPPRAWPLMTLSVAVVTNENQALISFLQASSLLLKLMLRIKARGGDQWAGIR